MTGHAPYRYATKLILSGQKMMVNLSIIGEKTSLENS
jgi:hypothetical protein